MCQIFSKSIKSLQMSALIYLIKPLFNHEKLVCDQCLGLFWMMQCEVHFVSCVLQNVGCDFGIESNAVEDRCGVCNGNGSTCTTVRRTFEETEGLGMFPLMVSPPLNQHDF